MLQRLSANERHFLYDILLLLLFSFDTVSLFLIRDDTIVVHIMFHRRRVVKQIKDTREGREYTVKNTQKGR